MEEFYIERKKEKIGKFEVFFTHFIESFIKESEKLYRKWEEYPFIHSERKLNTILAPTFCDMKMKNPNLEIEVFYELPFKSNDKSQRFLDYYIEYDNDIYLIELKHAWQNFKMDGDINTNEHTDKVWEKSIEQIQTLSKTAVKQIVDGKDNIYRVALMVMPIWSQKIPDKKVISPKSYAQGLMKEFDKWTSKKYKANFIGVWKIKKFDTKGHEFEKNRNEYYPYVSFIAKVEPIWS